MDTTKQGTRRPRGLYIYMNAQFIPVTGPQQSRFASSLILEGHTRWIERWTGTEFVSTGLVLHGSRKPS